MATDYELTEEPSSDEHAGHVASMVAAAKRRLTYYDQAMRRWIGNGGRVVSGDFEWKQTNGGFRWVKRSQ